MNPYTVIVNKIRKVTSCTSVIETVELTVFAKDVESAKEVAMAAEGCPRSAIESVTVANLKQVTMIFRR